MDSLYETARTLELIIDLEVNNMCALCKHKNTVKYSKMNRIICDRLSVGHSIYIIPHRYKRISEFNCKYFSFNYNEFSYIVDKINWNFSLLRDSGSIL